MGPYPIIISMLYNGITKLMNTNKEAFVGSKVETTACPPLRLRFKFNYTPLKAHQKI